MRIVSEVFGYCMAKRGMPTHCEAVIDPEAAVISGDRVRVQVANRQWIIKDLRVTRDGRWFLDCDDGLIAISRYTCVPSAMQKVVEVRPLTRSPHVTAYLPGVAADAKAMRIYRAFSEGLTLADFVDGVPWPGIDAALDSFPWPADFNDRYARAAQ